jgi:hypothetical protein
MGIAGATGRRRRDAHPRTSTHARERERPCPRSTPADDATATTEKYIDALTDFGPGRSKVVGNRADGDLQVHSEGDHPADVTEGSVGVWESAGTAIAPSRIRSWPGPPTPTSGGDSGDAYTFTRRPDGTTDIDYVVVREGKTAKGRFLGVVLGSVGKRALAKSFVNSVKPLEVRSRAATADHM